MKSKFSALLVFFFGCVAFSFAQTECPDYNVFYPFEGNTINKKWFYETEVVVGNGGEVSYVAHRYKALKCDKIALTGVTGKIEIQTETGIVKGFTTPDTVCMNAHGQTINCSQVLEKFLLDYAVRIWTTFPKRGKIGYLQLLTDSW